MQRSNGAYSQCNAARRRAFMMMMVMVMMVYRYIPRRVNFKSGIYLQPREGRSGYS